MKNKSEEYMTNDYINKEYTCVQIGLRKIMSQAHTIGDIKQRT